MLKKLMVRTRQGIYVFPISDIVYMEKRLRKICMHTMERSIEFYGKFQEVMPFLDDRFMYCHRSYVINMEFVVWMSANTIYMGKDDHIYLGRDTYGRARKIFTKYMSEKRPNRDWSVRMWL